MNKREKIVQEQFINDEEAVIRRLKKVYGQALEDINKNAKDLQTEIEGLNFLYDSIEDEKEKAKLKSMQQSKIYQKQYQDAMKKQISGILDTMQVEEFKTVSGYLNKCYEEGFLGTMYNLQGQGIPLVFPMDQEAIVRAVQLDSKISKGLYSRLGEDVDLLKRKITATISRGISTGMRYEQVAQQLAGYTNIGFNNAVRIARTEGHRIQVQSTMDACYKAKDKGANVVKQWDASLDKKTRDSHAKVDGEVRELDEKFSNGLRFPSDPHGSAAEVVNCRCALLQRAKWALNEEELETLKERAAYYGLDKSDEFDDFKKKYLNAAEGMKPINPADALSFTKEQAEAIEWYVSGEGQWINQYLRGKGDFGNLSPDEEFLLKTLTEATDRMLPDGIEKLYRSVDAKAIFGDIDWMDWERLEGALIYGNETDLKKIQSLIDRTKGKTITEKGFLSTSKKYDVIQDWGDFTGAEMPVNIEFDVPKGMKGADLFDFDIEGDEQFEVLFARNSKYKIKDITSKDGRIYIKATFEPEDVIDEIEKSVKKNIIEVEKMSVDNFPASFKKGAEKKNTQTLVDYVNDVKGANPDTLRLYNSMGKMENIESQGIKFKISHAKGKAVETTSKYTGEMVEAKLTIPKLSGDNIAGQVNTTLHEDMHLIDLYLRKDVSKSGNWFSSSRKELVDVFKNTPTNIGDDVSKLFKDFNEECGKVRKAITDKLKEDDAALREKYFPNGQSVWSDFKKYEQLEKERKKLYAAANVEIDYQQRNIMGGGVNALQDIYDALSGGHYRDTGVVKYGHGSKYYGSTGVKIEETLANYGSLSVTRPDLIEMLRADKPELVAELEATVKAMLEKVGG